MSAEISVGEPQVGETRRIAEISPRNRRFELLPEERLNVFLISIFLRSINCHVICADFANASTSTALNAFVIGITLTDATNCLNRI